MIRKSELPKAMNERVSVPIYACVQNAETHYHLSFFKDCAVYYLPSSTSKTGMPSFFLDSEDSLRNPYSKAYSTAYSSFFSPIKVSNCVV